MLRGLSSVATRSCRNSKIWRAFCRSSLLSSHSAAGSISAFQAIALHYFFQRAGFATASSSLNQALPSLRCHFDSRLQTKLDAGLADIQQVARVPAYCGRWLTLRSPSTMTENRSRLSTFLPASFWPVRVNSTQIFEWSLIIGHRITATGCGKD